ncbi:MAG TPA: capsule assembly Wzi family protein, partial [Longimicrobiales bacterium]|nr:capsule assembly Wzi family protein [Longimicrobiales bacterium]
PFLVVVTAVALASPEAARAQSAATVAPTDPVYADLERLEAFGLVPRGLSSQRPLSIGRLTWLVREARGSEKALEDLDAGTRHDVEALLQRVERRLKLGGGTATSGAVELELGGGMSPGRWFPSRGGGEGRLVDAVSNPLWSNQGGRGYGDRATASVAGRLDLGAGSAAALSLGGRAAWWNASGPVGGRGRNTIETVSGRVVLGAMALEVGRNAAVWGRTGMTPLLLSDNGVPLDLVRVATDRPVSIPLLGDVDFTALLADLGPRQHFPHAKEFGLRMEARPAVGVTIGVAVLNKQGGQGAPEATLRQRIWDASVVGPAIFGDDRTPFSDKILGMDVRWILSSLRGTE